MAVHKEGDAKASHRVLFAVHFYSKWICFLLPYLERLANQYISELRAKIEAAGPNSFSWGKYRQARPRESNYAGLLHVQGMGVACNLEEGYEAKAI
jgi:hypothetical protein